MIILAQTDLEEQPEIDNINQKYPLDLAKAVVTSAAINQIIESFKLTPDARNLPQLLQSAENWKNQAFLKTQQQFSTGETNFNILDAICKELCGKNLMFILPIDITTVSGTIKAQADNNIEVIAPTLNYLDSHSSVEAILGENTMLQANFSTFMNNQKKKLGTPGIPAPKMAKKAQIGPLGAGRYESINQLRNELIQLGPKPETYNKFMSLGGQNQEDSIKTLLGEFFQGSAAALGSLYQILVDSGLANPIDSEIVEAVMTTHPELNKSQQVAGLWLPPSSLGTKTAALAPVQMYGPDDNKYCVKLRRPVSTYICRFHCQDGLAIDDHMVACGEALWRRNQMDKFSMETVDKDGNLVGGYIKNRFKVENNHGGRPAIIPQGKRNNPIHEDAWSLEKRLTNNRGDKKNDLYNHDPYEVLGTTTAASTKQVKTAQMDMATDSFSVQQHPEEFSEPDTFDHITNELKSLLATNTIIDEVKLNEIAQMYGVDTNIVKEILNKEVQIKNASSNSWSLKKTATQTTDPEIVDGGQKCLNCNGNVASSLTVCQNCGSTKLKPQTKMDAHKNSGTLPKNDLAMPTASMNAKVVVANGIYAAMKDNNVAYGESEAEALNKLAQVLMPKGDIAKKLETPPTLEEANEDILSHEQQINKNVITPEKPVIKDNINIPNTIIVPPTEVQDGKSEFNNNEINSTENLEDISEINPIDNTEDSFDPESKEDLEAQAIAAGAGPE